MVFVDESIEHLVEIIGIHRNMSWSHHFLFRENIDFLFEFMEISDSMGILYYTVGSTSITYPVFEYL